jgi:hypothetical protein
MFGPITRAVEHVECGKQRGRPFAFVIVRHVPRRPGFIGKLGGVAVERLDLSSVT